MNKDPDKMQINDALDLFEENGAPIRLEKGRCNVQEQYGNVIGKKRLYNPTTKEEQRLAAQFGRAFELILERLRDKDKKEKLIELLELREQYRPKTGDKKQDDATPKPENSTPKTNNRRRDNDTNGRNNGANGANGRNNAGHQDRSNGNANGNNNAGRTSTENKGKARPTKIEYTRGPRTFGAGNSVQVLEIPVDSKGINVPLKAGGRLKFSPPLVPEDVIRTYQMKTGQKIDIKRYLVIESTPDNKIFINIVYGNLDIEQMKTNPQYLNLCMTTILSRKRIDEICRNYFCTLDELIFDRGRNVTTRRNDLNTGLVAMTLLTASGEIKTTRQKGFMDTIFGEPQKEENNILRIFKTGVIMVNGKECSVYSYGTRDETIDASSGQIFENGSFIISGFDEERFRTDRRYQERVITTVFTPSRLKNSRRRDILYPYIGGINASGSFENDFEIYEEFQKMEREAQR